MKLNLSKAIAVARTLIFDTPDVSIDEKTMENGRSIVLVRDGVYNHAYEPADIVAWAATLDGVEYARERRSERYQSLCDAYDPIDEQRVARELAEQHGVIIYDGGCDRIYDGAIDADRDNIVFADDCQHAARDGISLLWIADSGDIFGGWMNDDEAAFAEAIAEECEFIGEPETPESIEARIERVPYLTDDELAEKS